MTQNYLGAKSAGSVEMLDLGPLKGVEGFLRQETEDRLEADYLHLEEAVD